ncbi:MAG: hypothetical protein NZ739_11310 [Verrucomicrobiae bacterium]|nr:hypothetical protein [Verrucomicrobiae bacterium]MDW7997022.1 RHS repeat-associated core domain-containing protein [Bacteroidota bacterium]
MNPSGSITIRYTYEAYGLTQTAASTPTPETSLLYCGEQYDSVLRMYNLRARFYDPVTGRFTTRDTFVGNNFDPQSLHKYAYCHCDPVNRVDASGRHGLLVTTLTVAGIGAGIGMLATAAAVYAYQGRVATFGEILTGGVLGALFAVGAFWIPELAIMLGLYGVITTAIGAYGVWADPNIPWDRKVLATVLFIASAYGTAKAVQYTRVMRGYVPGNSKEASLIPQGYGDRIGAVDTRGCLNPRDGYTASGMPRDRVWFWNRLLERNPEWFSEANRVRILSGRPRAPIVDETWVNAFPNHRAYIGSVLVHHHVLQGPVAVPVPKLVHATWYRALHRGVPDVIEPPPA